MIYVVLKRMADTDDRLCCLVKAESYQEANVMAGIDKNNNDWVGFTEGDLQSIVSVKEGYIARKM